MINNLIEEVKKRKHEIKTLLIGVLIMLFTVIIIIAINSSVSDDKSDQINISSARDADSGKTLNVWYCDKGYETYINELSKIYEKEKNIKINAIYVSEYNYLENINSANKKTIKDNIPAPDVYIMDSTGLEAAYGYGLADINDNKDYNKKNYLQKSLDAVTYKGKYVAYPLAYNTAFLIYNKQYMDQAPATFEDISAYADGFDGTVFTGVSNIISWKADKVIYNYGFVGNYLEFGAKSGDDESKLILNSDETKNALGQYKAFCDKFGITAENSDNSEIVNNFVNGKLVCMIGDMSDFLSVKNQAQTINFDYGVALYPDINTEIKSSSLSRTDVMVVNYLSDNKKMAREFAKYATYDKCRLVGKYTEKMPVLKCNFKEENLLTIQKQYEKSTGFPKLMFSNDYSMQIQSIFEGVLNGNDISLSLDNLNNLFLQRCIK